MTQVNYELLKYYRANPEINTPKNFTSDQLYDHLRAFSKREQIYKEYHEIKHDPVATKHFLESLDPQFVVTYGLQFPKEDIVAQLDNYPENLFFSTQYLYDIALLMHPRYSPVTPHMHDFFEAVYVLEGEMDHTVSNYTFHMAVGDFCIVPPNTEHSVSVFSDDTIVINLLIRYSTFENIFYNLLRGNNILSSFFLDSLHTKNASDYILFHTGQDALIRNAIMNMMLEFENEEMYFSDILNSQLVTFLGFLLRRHDTHYELPPSVNKENVLFYELTNFIYNNYKTVTLNDISARFHYTSEYTSRLIKNITGSNFTKLLFDIRMKRAADMLSNTSMPIADIGENIGYLNPEHFTRAFKKVYGDSPREYRKQNKKQKRNEDL